MKRFNTGKNKPLADVRDFCSVGSKASGRPVFIGPGLVSCKPDRQPCPERVGDGADCRYREKQSRQSGAPTAALMGVEDEKGIY